MWRLVGNKRVILELPSVFGRSVPVSSIPRAAVAKRSIQVRLPSAAELQTLLHSAFSAEINKLGY